MNATLIVLAVAGISVAAVGVYALRAVPRGAPWPRTIWAGCLLGTALAAGPVLIAQIVLGVLP